MCVCVRALVHYGPPRLLLLTGFMSQSVSVLKDLFRNSSSIDLRLIVDRYSDVQQMFILFCTAYVQHRLRAELSNVFKR